MIEQSTVYYVHRSNCREVRTLSEDADSEKNQMMAGNTQCEKL